MLAQHMKGSGFNPRTTKISKQQRFILAHLEGRCLRAQGGQGHSPSKVCARTLPVSLLTCGGIIPLRLIIAPPSTPVSLTKMLATDLGPSGSPGRCHLKIFNIITSAKSSFSKLGHCYRSWGVGHMFWRAPVSSLQP
jgi:hypothetical protein